MELKKQGFCLSEKFANIYLNEAISSVYFGTYHLIDLEDNDCREGFRGLIMDVRSSYVAGKQ